MEISTIYADKKKTFYGNEMVEAIPYRNELVVTITTKNLTYFNAFISRVHYKWLQ